MRILRIFGLVAALTFTVGFVGYLVTRPAPGLHFVQPGDAFK